MRAALDLCAPRRPVQNLPENQPWTARAARFPRCRQVLGTRAGSRPDSRAAGPADPGASAPPWLLRRGCTAQCSSNLSPSANPELCAQEGGVTAEASASGRRGRGAGPVLLGGPKRGPVHRAAAPLVAVSPPVAEMPRVVSVCTCAPCACRSGAVGARVTAANYPARRFTVRPSVDERVCSFTWHTEDSQNPAVAAA